MEQEKFQEIELRGSELQFALAHKDAARRAVQAKGAAQRWRRSAIHLAAPEVGFDACDELTRAEGPDSAVVAADRQAKDAIDLIGSSGQEQHGGSIEKPAGANLAAEFEAVGLGEHDVQNDEVGLGLLQGFQRAGRSAEHVGLVSLAGEIVLDQR